MTRRNIDKKIVYSPLVAGLEMFADGLDVPVRNEALWLDRTPKRLDKVIETPATEFLLCLTARKA